MTPLAAIRRDAEGADSVELRPEEPHGAGMAAGLASVGLGLWAAQAGDAAARWGWVALAGVVVSAALYTRWTVKGPGWRVDFRARRIEPVGQPGEPVQVEGRGWSVGVGPADRFAHLAIDLRHEDRGRVARLLEAASLRRVQRRQISAIADALAQRLKAARSGARF
jgi:hypothetical protein